MNNYCCIYTSCKVWFINSFTIYPFSSNVRWVCNSDAQVLYTCIKLNSAVTSYSLPMRMPSSFNTTLLPVRILILIRRLRAARRAEAILPTPAIRHPVSTETKQLPITHANDAQSRLIMSVSLSWWLVCSPADGAPVAFLYHSVTLYRGIPRWFRTL